MRTKSAVTSILVLVLAFGAEVSAQKAGQPAGQSQQVIKPAPAAKPVLPKPTASEPSSGTKTSAPAAPSGSVELMCKNFVFGDMPNGIPFRSNLVTFEAVSITDATGRAKKIYAPGRIVVEHQFKPAATVAGPRGDRLANGECGLATSVIPGDSASLSSSTPRLQLMDFPSMTVATTKKGADSSNMDVAIALPPCPSGVRRFRASNSNGVFFVNGAVDGALSCVD